MTKARGPDHPQRRHQRTAASRRVLIHCRAAAGEDAVRASLCDVSQSGIGLILESPLAAGQTFGLDLNRPDGTATRLLYTVIHCRPCGERMFRIGAELTSRQAPRPASHAHETPTATPMQSHR